MKIIWMVLVALLVLGACSPSEQTAGFEFRDAWVREMPPGSRMTAGFGRWVNPGPAELEISALSSPDFKSITLHQTVNADGVSRMQAVPEIRIPGDSELVLEPGGYHLMLMGPSTKIGESIDLNVLLSNGQSFLFELPIERR